MPKPTFHNLPEAKKLRIVEAAIDEFASVPFEAASVNRVVRGAGIAKGSFYQYFDGLLDLYRYVLIEVAVERKLNWFGDHSLPPDLGLFGQLAWYAVVGLRWGMSEPHLSAALRQMMVPVPQASPLHQLQQELRAVGQANTLHMLQQGQATGAVREDIDLPLAAALMQVVLQQGLDALLVERVGFDMITLCMHPEHAAQVSAVDLEAVASTLIDLLRRGIGGAEDSGTVEMDAIRASLRDLSDSR